MVNVWLSNKMLCQPSLSKFINLIHYHCTGITRFNIPHRFGFDCVTGYKETWKDDSPQNTGKAQGSSDSVEPPKLYSITVIERMEDSCLRGMRHPLLKGVEKAAIQCLPSIGNEPAPEGILACNGYTLKSFSDANLNGWTPTGENSGHLRNWNQKSNTITNNNIKENQWDAQVRKRKLTWGGPMAF